MTLPPSYGEHGELFEKAVADYNYLDAALPGVKNGEIASLLQRLQGTAQKIISYCDEHSNRLSTVSRFVNYYQDRTVTLVSQYISLRDAGISSNTFSNSASVSVEMGETTPYAKYAWHIASNALVFIPGVGGALLGMLFNNKEDNIRENKAKLRKAIAEGTDPMLTQVFDKYRSINTELLQEAIAYSNQPGFVSSIENIARIPGKCFLLIADQGHLNQEKIGSLIGDDFKMLKSEKAEDARKNIIASILGGEVDQLN